VSSQVAARLATLAAVALLAGLAALALERRGDGEAARPPLPAPWAVATVVVLDGNPPGERSACGVGLGAGLRGVVHPALPCGTRLVLAGSGREIEATVVDRRGLPPGAAFALTPQLAVYLGVAERATVRWRLPTPE
jgi:hypothetical protein